MKKVIKKAKSNNFVVYDGVDGEMLVTTEAMEKKMLKVWMFGDTEDTNTERYISDYDRYVVPEKELAVMITMRNQMEIKNGFYK